MSTQQMRLVLNCFCWQFKQNIAPINAQWGIAYSGVPSRVFEGKIQRKNFESIQSIADARHSIALANASGNLAFQVSEYAKTLLETQYDRPLLLCFELAIAAAATNMRRVVLDPGFSMRLWLDDTWAHFDIALTGGVI